MAKDKVGPSDVSIHGYYLYKDGTVCWGEGTYRGYFPIKITKELTEKEVVEKNEAGEEIKKKVSKNKEELAKLFEDEFIRIEKERIEKNKEDKK